MSGRLTTTARITKGRGLAMIVWEFWVFIFPFIVLIIYSIIEEKREGKR